LYLHAAEKRNPPAVLKLVQILCVLISAACVSVSADGRSRVKISIPAVGQIRVDTELSTPARSWSFRNAYAGALGLAERVDEFQAFTASGKDVSAKKSATGEFRSDLEAGRISYTVRLSNPRASDLPHVSWLAEDRGFLMFADLLPVEIASLSAEFVLPTEWTVESSMVPDANRRYEVSAPEKSVFFLGRLLRKASKIAGGMTLETVVNGAWRFNEDAAMNAATEVMEKYLALTGFRLPGKSVIMIAASPVALGNSIWKAETRGSSVVVLMDPAARSKNSLGQLRVIFTHELLHLWVPNSLKLEGDYDWFFEGFTLYMALQTALELKVINFKGFLTTLAGVFDSYSSHPDELSLIQESERRWTSAGSQVYVKGMLVAFLYDLLVRKESGGKTTLAAVYRDLFNGHIADGANGNEAIIRLLGSSPAGKDFVKSYVENIKEIKLEQLLPAYGLHLDSNGTTSQLQVGRELNEDQKQLLRSLGYRN
jgi:predicted metalloprotease with PDZ domain